MNTSFKNCVCYKYFLDTDLLNWHTGRCALLVRHHQHFCVFIAFIKLLKSYLVFPVYLFLVVCLVSLSPCLCLCLLPLSLSACELHSCTGGRRGYVAKNTLTLHHSLDFYVNHYLGIIHHERCGSLGVASAQFSVLGWINLGISVFSKHSLLGLYNTILAFLLSSMSTLVYVPPRKKMFSQPHTICTY